MMSVISGIVSALIPALLIVILKKSDEVNKNNMPDFRCFLITFAVYLVSDISLIILMHEKNRFFDSVSIVILANVMFILAVIDIRKRIIPNRYVFTLLFLRIVSVTVYGFFTGRLVPYAINLFAGVVTGFLVLGIISLISKKSLGAGDVKMYAMIGAFTGITGVMDILIYAAVFCAVSGLLLIALKKCTVKSSLPMAPFACMGTILYIFLGCV